MRHIPCPQGCTYEDRALTGHQRTAIIHGTPYPACSNCNALLIDTDGDRAQRDVDAGIKYCCACSAPNPQHAERCEECSNLTFNPRHTRQPGDRIEADNGRRGTIKERWDTELYWIAWDDGTQDCINVDSFHVIR